MESAKENDIGVDAALLIGEHSPVTDQSNRQRCLLGSRIAPQLDGTSRIALAVWPIVRSRCILLIIALGVGWSSLVVDARAQAAEPSPEFPSQAPQFHDNSTSPKATAPFTQLLREGEALAKAREYDRAIESYNRALALGAPTPLAESIALTYRAGALSRLGRIQEAISDHDRAVSLDSNAFTRWARAETLQKAQRLKEALSDYDTALRLAPDNAQSLVGRGRVLASLGQHDAAIAAFDRAVAIKPDAHSLSNRGFYLATRGELDSAIRDFSSAIQADPTDLPARINRANAYSKRGDLDRALAEYETVLRTSGPNALAYRGRGWAYERHGRIDLARADYERALQLSPSDTWLQNALKNLPSRK
jgi:tetratricopeptide (TPR) repeat protein